MRARTAALTPRRAAAIAWILSASIVAPSVLSITSVANADADQDKKIATDLFDKGVATMNASKCDEAPTDPAACRKALDDFRRAYQLYPAALGALRNIAYIEKALGMVASAARDFRELARKAPLDPKPERQKWADYAREEVKALEPRIAHLTVKIPADRPPGTKVVLDDVPLPEAAWDTVIDVDPGTRAVHAEAPGRLSFDGSVTLAEAQSKSISVLLDADTHAVAEASSSRTLPIVVAGLGVVGVGVGLGLGYASLKKKNDACGDSKLCDPDGLSQGRSLASASTIVTSIGAVALVSGVVWYLLSPSSSSSPSSDRSTSTAFAPYATTDGAGLAAFGRF